MGYIPGEPDEGFLNGSIPTTHATNSFVVGSSNAEPVQPSVEPPADDADEQAPAAPPRGGAGSGIDEWRAHALQVHGLEFDDDVTRDEIIAAVDAHSRA